MAKMKGAKTLSPSARSSRPRVSPVRDSMTEPPQLPVMQPSEDGVPPSPSQRRYQTRRPPTTPGASSSPPKKSVSRSLAKKSRVSGPIEPLEPPQPHPPTTESQIPSGMTPEVIIR
ncbi:leucine-rich repeat extensin-like protein 5 [Vitis riparia]|uniref:leucine-rich repeat extensin-like protein 5 n=1 Tax=Vitis riparia TaxID=96939 RepID=UPI00155A68CD|nr:leucine-rich repeat extensin-like protein 5 [Vitis riparia]